MCINIVSEHIYKLWLGFNIWAKGAKEQQRLQTVDTVGWPDMQKWAACNYCCFKATLCKKLNITINSVVWNEFTVSHTVCVIIWRKTLLSLIACGSRFKISTEKSDRGCFICSNLFLHKHKTVPCDLQCWKSSSKRLVDIRSVWQVHSKMERHFLCWNQPMRWSREKKRRGPLEVCPAAKHQS